MLVRDRIHAVFSDGSSVPASSMPQGDQFLPWTKWFCSLTPSTVVQGHVGLLMGPVPGSMTSSHSVMSASDVRFTLNHGFTASSDPTSAIPVLFLGGLAKPTEFWGWFSGCCVIYGYLGWATAVGAIAWIIAAVLYYSLSVLGQQQCSFASSVRGGGSGSALLDRIFHLAASVAPSASGYTLAGCGQVSETTDHFRQGQSCPVAPTWVCTTPCLTFPPGVYLGALHLQSDGLGKHGGGAGLWRLAWGKPQTWSGGACDVPCGWSTFCHTVPYSSSLPFGSVSSFQSPSAHVSFPQVSAHSFPPISNFSSVPFSPSSVFLDYIHMPYLPPFSWVSPLVSLFLVSSVPFFLFFQFPQSLLLL